MGKPLSDLFAAADIVISRAGANAICELLALRKPALLIPLSAEASRGDQILNARSFQKQGFSAVLEEDQLTADTLCQNIFSLYENRKQYIQAMESSQLADAVSQITALLKKLAGIPS